MHGPILGLTALGTVAPFVVVLALQVHFLWSLVTDPEEARAEKGLHIPSNEDKVARPIQH